jgi:hypothetical protein
MRKWVRDSDIFVREAVGAKRIIVAYTNFPVGAIHEYLISQMCSPAAYCVARQWSIVMMVDRT